MGLFSFGKKDDAAPRRRGAEAGSNRRSSQSTRVERRSRRPDRSGDAEAMLLDPTLPEKQRARRRLVGAIALVLAAIVVLPMVLDSHPKPVTDDIAIDIPSRPADKVAARHDEDTQAGVAPDNPPAADTAGASALTAASSTSPSTSTQAAEARKPGAVAPKPSQGTAAEQPAQPAQSAQSTQPAQTARTGKPATAPAATATASRGPSDTTGTATQANADTGAGAQSGTPAAPPGARFAVQLGAYTNGATARNWVAKLKAAGVPAYTEERKEADGTTRTLLRAGPFPDRASATAAIARVRGAGLMAGSNSNAE